MAKKLADLGYKFDEAGKLRVIAKDPKQDQDALVSAMMDYVQEMMMNKNHLRRVAVPLDNQLTSFEDSKVANVVGKSHIFVSSDFFQNQDKLLVLIQGSGEVRPGVWSRAVCIHESLVLGSMLPYIDRAQKEGYAVIVLNPNENDYPLDNKWQGIIGSESPQNHCQYVWKHIISKSSAKIIDFVCHSYGGVCVVSMINECEKFKTRVHKIALTDSVHEMREDDSRAPWFLKHAINWVTSHERVDSTLQVRHGACQNRSAGHIKHTYTSGTAFGSVFDWLAEPLSE